MSNIKLENIFNLRKLMKKKCIDGYIIPHHDENFSEYVPKNKERLYWISGFSGSAGTLFIAHNQMLLFTDGRYILQAKNQTKNLKCKIINTAEYTLLDFLKDNQSKFNSIGIESKTISFSEYYNISSVISKSTIKLKIINNNLIDFIWKRKLNTQDASKIFFLSQKYCGESIKRKLTKAFNYLLKEKADFIFTQNSESIAWLFNMRGNDLPHTPLVFCSALIGKNQQKLFFEDKNVPEKVKKKFPKQTGIYSYSEMNKVLKSSCKSSKVIIDQKKLSLFNYNLLKKITKTLLVRDDILLSYRSIKNSTEIECSKKAHLFDAVSLCKFLYWYKSYNGALSELDVVNKINSLRKESAHFISPSFPTIAGAGENGAIIHYQPNKKTNKNITNNDILLLDSGGQYFYGTTDVTRTITRKKNIVKKNIIHDYTLVLKSHINVNLCKFPQGTPGSFLDSTARKILWDNGEDFAHSTGHGVGFCLNVHEGPFSISLKNLSPIYEKMIFSNEPGLYKTGKYGIRIENLVYTKIKYFNKKEFLTLETLTLVPYEKELIDVSLLSLVEKNWLNNYHKNVIKNVSPYLNKKEKKWLKIECKKI